MSKIGIWRGVPYEIDGDNVVLGQDGQTFEMESLTIHDAGYYFSDICDGKHLSVKGTVVLPEDCFNVFGASDLQTVDGRGFDFSKVKNADSMFAEDIDLEKINLHGANMKNVTNMSAFFADCSRLKDVDMVGVDTSNVQSMYEMFAGCYDLESIDVSSFDTSKVEKFGDMFCECSMDVLDLSNFDTRNAYDASEAFESCEAKRIYINKDLWRNNGRGLPSNMKSKEDFEAKSKRETLFHGVPYTFEKGCLTIGKQGETYNLSTLSAKHGDYDMLRKETVKVITKGRINIIHGDDMFADYKNLRFVNLSSMNTDKCISLDHMLAGCTSLEEVDISHMNFDSLSEKDRYIEGFGSNLDGRDILTGGSGPKAIYVSNEYYRGLSNAMEEHITELGEDFYGATYILQYGVNDIKSEIMDKYHPVRELPQKEHIYDGRNDKAKRFQDLQSMLDSLTEERGFNTHNVDMDGPEM